MHAVGRCIQFCWIALRYMGTTDTAMSVWKICLGNQTGIKTLYFQSFGRVWSCYMANTVKFTAHDTYHAYRRHCAQGYFKSKPHMTYHKLERCCPSEQRVLENDRHSAIKKSPAFLWKVLWYELTPATGLNPEQANSQYYYAFYIQSSTICYGIYSHPNLHSQLLH